MKKILVLLLLLPWLACAAGRGEGKKFLLFAILKEGTPVTLDDGGKWVMDKGDSFPLLMYKEQQTLLVLQLAGTRFTIPANVAEVVDEKKITPEMLAAYRRNVDAYLDSQARKWREALSATPAPSTPAPPSTPK